jgi:hypothetical protein
MAIQLLRRPRTSLSGLRGFACLYYEEVSMKEIGLILSITEPRVSQIRASAVLHLRARPAAPTFLKAPQNKPDGGRPERLSKGS